MRILYITTIGNTMSFFISFIKHLIDEGNKVDIATNENNGNNNVPGIYRELDCGVYQISCSREPFNIGNIKAIKEIRELVEKNRYDIVHCHTPIAAACTRIACRKSRKEGTKVFYTAHGFHFYNGAPLKNWIIYYPIEKICSHWTDALITINKEDYSRASKKFKAKKFFYVPGVGIDTQFFKPKQNGGQKIRAELGLNDEHVMILSVGELNRNKNHESVIKAIQGTNWTYVIVGKGELKSYLRSLADNCAVDVRLVGYRNDVVDFYHAANCYVLPSIREGLNVSLMEAMASGLPVACSNIRGNIDLINKPLFDPKCISEIKLAIKYALEKNDELRNKNLKMITSFDVKNINNTMDKLYK